MDSIQNSGRHSNVFRPQVRVSDFDRYSFCFVGQNVSQHHRGWASSGAPIEAIRVSQCVVSSGWQLSHYLTGFLVGLEECEVFVWLTGSPTCSTGFFISSLWWYAWECLFVSAQQPGHLSLVWLSVRAEENAKRKLVSNEHDTYWGNAITPQWQEWEGGLCFYRTMQQDTNSLFLFDIQVDLMQTEKTSLVTQQCVWWTIRWLCVFNGIAFLVSCAVSFDYNVFWLSVCIQCMQVE